jgi:hypothetical protein
MEDLAYSVPAGSVADNLALRHAINKAGNIMKCTSQTIFSSPTYILRRVLLKKPCVDEKAFDLKSRDEKIRTSDLPIQSGRDTIQQKSLQTFD